jgi:hypothetical protein
VRSAYLGEEIERKEVQEQLADIEAGTEEGELA